MTAPAPGPNGSSSSPRSRYAALTTAILAATALVAGATLVRTPAPPPGNAACPVGSQLVTMRAQDTAVAEVVGDTLFVQRTDTALAVDSATHQAFAILVDSGATVQMAAVCVPVDSAFRIRIVPELPSVTPAPGQLAYAILAGHGETMVPP